MYERIVHPGFRVIAHRYPTPDKTSIIPGDAYVDLIKREVIGGTPFKVVFKHISIEAHAATVVAHFRTKNGGGQLVTLLLVQNVDNSW